MNGHDDIHCNNGKNMNKGGNDMRKKWLLSIITPMLALTLITGCGMNNDKNEPNEPVDEEPLNREIENDDMDGNIEDENLRDRDQLDEDLNNDRTNEIDQEEES